MPSDKTRRMIVPSNGHFLHLIEIFQEAGKAALVGDEATEFCKSAGEIRAVAKYTPIFPGPAPEARARTAQDRAVEKRIGHDGKAYRLPRGCH